MKNLTDKLQIPPDVTDTELCKSYGEAFDALEELSEIASEANELVQKASRAQKEARKKVSRYRQALQDKV